MLAAHYREEANALADRMIVINHGRVIADGRPEELWGRVGKRYVRFQSSGGAEADLQVLPGVQRVNVENGTWRLLTVDAEGNLAR